MNVTLGEFYDSLPDTQEYLTLGFSPSAQARKIRWRNYGLSADFLGDYFATFFPGNNEDAADSSSTQENVKACISYVANELIENAIKFSDERVNSPVTISLYLYESSILLLVCNSTTTDRAIRFQKHIHDILTTDLDLLYAQRLEQMGREESNESCLGLISIMADYGVKMGWRFTPSTNDDNSVAISVMARLTV
ncbi:MAG: ATP-binding protein [Limnothrix sp. CACIAM 69d]|nr:MAG: ATP-binding protein [Limnothrix sp. CACIAM 69d]